MTYLEKTYQPKSADLKRTWHLIDAEGKVLGRLATEVATLLIGKNKPTYAPHADGGDYVVVINASGVVLTGKKEEQKTYRRHSGYPGGLKETLARQLRTQHPERLVTYAVSGMLPDNRLRQRRLARLHIYPGSGHPYGHLFNQVK